MHEGCAYSDLYLSSSCVPLYPLSIRDKKGEKVMGVVGEICGDIYDDAVLTIFEISMLLD